MNENEVVEEHCFMCMDAEVHHSDRWNFELVEEDGSDAESFWLCRNCHGKFDGLDDFEKFRTKDKNLPLYRSSARLQRLLLLGAPKVIVQQEVVAMMSRLLYDDDKVDQGFLETIKKKLERINA